MKSYMCQVKKGFTRTNFTKNLSGFTLIEVLIAAVIILVFSGISLAGYWQFNESKKLDEETKKFVETLMIAKQKAISGEARTCGDNGSFGLYWKSNFYIIQEGVGLPPIDGCTGNYYRIYLPNNIRFDSEKELYFNPFGYGVTSAYLTDPFGRYTAVLVNTETGKKRRVYINKSGLITIK